jgi:type I restriction enzyme S subunit
MSESVQTIYTLGDIADTNPETLPGNTLTSARFRYIDLSAVEAGFINWRAVTETTFGSAPSRARRIVKAQDVLFGTVRPNLRSHGFIGLDDSDSLVASTGFCVIRAREGVSHPSYLFHSLMSSRVTAQAVRDAIGSNYPAVNDSDIKRFEIFTPPYNEQRQIARILNTLDTAIHETETIIAKLRAVKLGMLQDLLTRGIGANGKLRPTQAEAPDLYKASPLGWIPRDWSCEPLSDLLEVKLGFAFSSHDYVDDGILSFRVTNIGQPSNDLGGIVKLPREFLEKFPNQRLDGGEIMIVMVGATTGKMGRVPHSICPALQNQNMWNLVPNEKLDREFAWIALPSLVDRHLKQAQGSARDFLTQSGFLVEFLGVPPVEEQAHISDNLGFAEKRIETEMDLLNKLRLQKIGLMDDLLIGRVRVTPLLAAEQQGAA